jgi:cytochrome c oxidase assembly protein subunit 15
MTGSGMGCPDWPKCFGSWIPPTNIEELPVDYKEIYSSRGYDKLDFNVFNTWAEYLNRLLGALSGVLCFGLFLISIKNWINHKSRYNGYLILYSAILVFLMGFQAWMGALVVYSILSPFKITIHMFIALLIVALLLFLYQFTASSFSKKNWPDIKTKWVFFALFILLTQILLGTQVRESIDELLHLYNKSNVISELPIIFTFHKTIAFLVLLSNVVVLFYYRTAIRSLFELQMIILIICLLFLTGLFMNYQAFVGVYQWIHLISAVSLFMCQFSLLLKQFNFPTLKFP